MDQLRFLRVLNNSTTTKQISILYKTVDSALAPDASIETLESFLAEHPSGLAIANAEKSAFKHDFITQGTDELIQSNDIYYRYLKTWQDTAKVNLINPCTITHIKKYMESDYEMIQETPQDYIEITLPWITSLPSQRTKWIRDMLNGIAEQDDILFNCEEFILAPDQKWDRTTVENLYYLAISRQEIKCLRELNGSHVPLLLKIQNESANAIEKAYGIGRSMLRYFIHYVPSYFHFHVHVVHVKMEATNGMICGQAHLLQDVIDNLRIWPDYYSKRTMEFALSTRHDLYPLLKKSK